jgi:H+-transporting ATPase
MNTFFGKTATMIQAVDDSLGNLQKILLKIMVVLVVLSITLCTIAFIYLMVAKDESFKEVYPSSRKCWISVVGNYHV